MLHIHKQCQRVGVSALLPSQWRGIGVLLIYVFLINYILCVYIIFILCGFLDTYVSFVKC